jgi:Flp pilus assembly CpaE family ATPase
VLPRDDAADAAVNRGLPLADIDQASPLRKAIVTLAYDLIVDQAEDQNHSCSGALAEQSEAP